MNSKIAIASSALPNGTRLGEFEITGVVGEGGFGIVYSAHDTTLERIVAVKEYLPSAFASRATDGVVKIRSDEHRKTFEAGLASFINEAKMLARFAHPGLVEVFRFWEANGTAYMAMRYYRGVTLRDTIRNDPQVITEDWLCQTLDPILLALRELHAEQCFHRDIAPDNIMVLPNGKSVLMDFGAARRIIGGMTRALTTVLKPGYAPIEQYSDDGAMQQGAWTDIYALGGVLYHAMTGKVPVQAISRMMADPLKDVGSIARNSYSPNLCGAVMKSLAVMPENRFQTIDELRAALGWVTTPVSSTVIVSAVPAAAMKPAVAPPPPPAAPVVAKSIAAAVATPSVPAKDPMAGLPKSSSAINDLLQKKPTAKPAVKIASADDPDEITVVGNNPSKSSKSKATSSKNDAKPPVEKALTATDAGTKKGPSAGLLVGIGLALIGVAIAAFLLTGRSTAPSKAADSVASTAKKTPTAPVESPAVKDPPPAVVVQQTPTASPSTPPEPTTPSAPTTAPNIQIVNPTAPPADDNKTADPPTAAVPDTGVLRVTVTGGWAAVSINGEPQGVTPRFSSRKLPPGTYTVELTNPSQAKITKTVEVVAGKTASVRHAY
jgi:serine/threonine protein kinase